MKRILFVMVIANTLTILGLNSCTKYDLPPVSGGNGGPGQPYTINLVASHWVQDASQIYYTNTFSNAISSASIGHTIKIYVVTNGTEIQINQMIFFMNGEVWATSIGTDIKINYQGSSQNLTPLNIKIVIE